MAGERPGTIGAVKPATGDLPALPERLAALVDAWVCNETDRGRHATLFGRGDDARLGAAVYVGRTFAGREDEGFGNPIHLRRGAPRAATLVAYFDWAQGPSLRAATLRRRLDAGELTGRPLSCWCHPEPCHAWLLCGWANGAVGDVAAWVEELRRSPAPLR